MDSNNTPTEPLPLQREAAAQIEQVPKKRDPFRMYPLIMVGLLLMAAIILGPITARWIQSMQVETVFPDAPSLSTASECGVEQKVTIPEVQGVIYSTKRSGDSLEVTAKPLSNHYVLSKGAATHWEVSLTPIPCPEPSSKAADQNPKDYVGDAVNGAKEMGTEAWDWTKKYGPGIWDRIKDLGRDAKKSVEDWSQSKAE